MTAHCSCAGKKKRMSESNFFFILCVSLQEYAPYVATVFSYMSPTRKRIC